MAFSERYLIAEVEWKFQRFLLSKYSTSLFSSEDDSLLRKAAFSLDRRVNLPQHLRLIGITHRQLIKKQKPSLGVTFYGSKCQEKGSGPSGD